MTTLGELLAVFGLVALIAESKPTRGLRRVAPRFFGCYLCLGFWIALALAVVRHAPDWPLVTMITCAGAGTSWLLGTVARAHSSDLD